MGAERTAERTPVGTSPALPVTFYLAGEPDLAGISRLDPDSDHQAFRPGELSWVAQTFLRLRAAGHPVALAGEAPESGLVVFHAKHKHALARSANGRNGLVFVAIRADNSAPLLADFEVLQSGRFADNRNRFWIPFWPQPGLLERDPARGTTLERVAYMGRIENLHPEFRGAPWRQALHDLGLEWVLREVRFERARGSGRDGKANGAKPASAGPAIDWEDYRALDAVIAVRPWEPHLRFAKPASKLINAWRAGVPALVGPEYACREIRHSPDDFLEVADASQALAALRRLREEPGLYARMVAAGQARAPEFSFAALTRRWAELLYETIPLRLAMGAIPWSHRLPLPVRLPFRRGLRFLKAARSR